MLDSLPLRPICPVQGRCEKADVCNMKGVHEWCNRFKELVTKARDTSNPKSN